MIVFTTTLILIIAAVAARAGVATSSGSIHSLGDHFPLSGHQLSSPSAGKLFLCGIVVRIAGRACGRPQPGGRLRECRSPKSERTALDRPGVRRDTPSKKERR